MIKLGKALLLTSLLATSTVVAADKEYTKVDRIKDMITMAGGMDEIQKGLLYRCEDGKCIKKGADSIKAVLVNLEKVDPNDFLDKDQQYAHKFSKKRQIMLWMYINEMLDELRDKNMDAVAQNYGLALRECTSCHMKLRPTKK
ncbi:MAG: hypothetical protein K0U38_02820 [Epsilonproteobacteria bacterium]|nr:hypothetical protein [Campylobacterota bacterium]